MVRLEEEEEGVDVVVLTPILVVQTHFFEVGVDLPVVILREVEQAEEDLQAEDEGVADLEGDLVIPPHPQ